MRGDAPPTCGAESSEWVFAAVNCSILPDVRHVHMSENMCICPSLDQHGHMHRTYTRGRVGTFFSTKVGFWATPISHFYFFVLIFHRASAQPSTMDTISFSFSFGAKRKTYRNTPSCQKASGCFAKIYNVSSLRACSRDEIKKNETKKSL